jgi:cyclopropane fatty-acyl-phospholipid synthase-like methyltransferase
MSLSYSSVIGKAHYHHAEFHILKQKLAALHADGKRKFFDVGFGRGKFLDLAAGTGYEVFGVEVNHDYISSAQSKGYKCVHLDELKSVSEKFDVILISHVVEHLHPQELIEVLSGYIDMLQEDGTLIIASPVHGDRFYYDITHIRPYYPQSIWHSFGENKEELSLRRGQQSLVLRDIYFIRDSYRTRNNRAYYIRDGLGISHTCLRIVNYMLAQLYLLSGYRIGVRASWIGFYSKRTRTQ